MKKTPSLHDRGSDCNGNEGLVASGFWCFWLACAAQRSKTSQNTKKARSQQARIAVESAVLGPMDADSLAPAAPKIEKKKLA